MKAFKTYDQCPEAQRPAGIPVQWPWQVQECEESDRASLEALGFSVVTDAEYTNYLSVYQSAFNTWNDNYEMYRLKDVTPRQIRQALVLNGVSMEQIQTALESLSEPTRTLALIEWEYSISFQRTRPLVISVGQMLGWTPAQLNALWSYAAAL